MKKRLIRLIPTIFLSISFLILISLVKGVPGNVGPSDIKNKLDQATKPFELSPERGRYATLFSLAENGRFDISKEWAEAVYPDVGYIKGKYYPYFTPGVSLLAVPFYIIGKSFDLAQFFSFLISSFFAVFTGLILFTISRNVFKIHILLSLFVSLTYIFASPALAYATSLYQHHITTFIILMAFYAVWHVKNKVGNIWLWSSIFWSLVGVGLFVDYPNAFMMMPLVIYFVYSGIHSQIEKGRLKIEIYIPLFITSLVCVILVLLHGYFNFVHFGGWQKTSGGLIGYKDIKESKSIAEIEMKKTKKTEIGLFKETNLVNGFLTLTVKLDKGIFIFSPIFILAIVFLFQTQLYHKHKSEVYLLLAICLANVFLYASFGDPWGGWAFGPRYLIPSTAILSLFLGLWLEGNRGFLYKIITLLLFIPSTMIALIGALTTNAVPPQIEADYLKMKYGFFYTYDFLKACKSGSYIFNTYLNQYISLISLFWIILTLILFMIIICIFVPKKNTI